MYECAHCGGTFHKDDSPPDVIDGTLDLVCEECTYELEDEPWYDEDEARDFADENPRDWY